MNSIDSIFSYYDKIIANLNPVQQAVISLLLLLFLVWQIFMIVKSGHWIFIALFIVLLPGTWPAARQIGRLVWLVVRFLLVRAQLLFS